MIINVYFVLFIFILFGSDAAVKHALQVREAIWTDNFHRFFLLYQQTPNMGNRILDLMVDTIRMQFVQRLCKAIKPQVSASFVLLETAFALTPEPIKSPSPARSSSSKSHKKSSHAAPVVVSEGLEFLKKIGCLLVKATDASTDGSLAVNSNFIEEEWDINTKDSVIDFSAVLTQDKLLL